MPPKKKEAIISAEDTKDKISSEPKSDEAASPFLQEQVYLLQLEVEKQRENLNTLRQNNEERKTYAREIFGMTQAWAIVIFILIIVSGIASAFKESFLSDKVLIALITTTTANFFGFFFLVVKYLFNPAGLPDNGDYKVARKKKSTSKSDGATI